MTTSSPITQRSRTQAPSPMSTRAPSVAPANTIAPVETTVPAPSTAGGSGSRDTVDRGDSTGCLPTIAWSCTITLSPSRVSGWMSASKRLRESLKDPDDGSSVQGYAAAVAFAANKCEKVLALESQRLVGRDLRDVDIAGPGLPLPV